MGCSIVCDFGIKKKERKRWNGGQGTKGSSADRHSFQGQCSLQMARRRYRIRGSERPAEAYMETQTVEAR